MEGIKLKLVRFERLYPHDMWQIDGNQNDDIWKVPIEDDCDEWIENSQGYDVVRPICNFRLSWKKCYEDAKILCCE